MPEGHEAEIHRGTETTGKSKSTMIKAQKDDIIRVDGYGEFSVVKRTENYYGPKIELSPEDGDGYYLLTAPSFDKQLQLWEAVRDEENFLQGYKRVEEVTADVVDTSQYDMCMQCGEPIASVEHERRALFGVCKGGHGD